MKWNKGQVLNLGRHDLSIWLVVSVALGAGSVFGFNQRWGGTSIAPAINTINIVASLLIHSLPVCLAAGLLFSSDASRNHFVDSARQNVNLSQSLAIRFSSLILLVSIYLGIITIAAFLVQGRGSLVGVAFVPALILAVVIVAVVICAVSVFITTAFDDWRFATIAGCILVIVFALVGGVSPSQLRYSSVPDLAVLGPQNMYRALAAVLMGYSFESLSEMRMYLGIIVEPAWLMIPIILAGVITLVSMKLSVGLCEKNLQRWSLQTPLWLQDRRSRVDGGEEISDGPTLSAEGERQLSILTKALKNQRQAITIFIGLVVVIAPISAIGYSNIRQSEAVNTLYISPAGGDVMQLKQWFAVELAISAPPEGQANWFTIECEVLDWDGCPDEVRWQYGFEEMSLDEFNMLNDTSRDDTFSIGGNRDREDSPWSTGSFNYGSSSGLWVWACRFSDPGSNSTNGHLVVILEMAVTVR
ncbi:MAG: hypothetical protein ACFFET_15995 [Candidatus Thorarchaeota archaeon]